MVKNLLRLEGLAVFLASLYFYSMLDASWFLFALLWLVPDISMVGYLKDKKVGAIVYNLAHTYLPVIVLIVFGLWQSDRFIISLGVIWSSHIGLDRFLGYGLKYPSEFKDTHIQKV
jgi:hypothetical protein